MVRLKTSVCVTVSLVVMCCLVSFKILRSSTIAGHRQELLLSGQATENERRVKNVIDACTAASLTVGETIQPFTTQDLLANPALLSNVIIDDNNKALYCYVPKVACTNWKRVMLVLSRTTNFTHPLSIPPDSVHRKNVFAKLSTFQPEDIQYRLLSYSSFIFVRHPIERVISAFRNKFERNYTSSAYFKRRFGVKIIKKYRKNIKPEEIPQSGDGVKFSEFVSYLIDVYKASPKLFNEHWAPFSSLCHPCAVRYRLIGKYETLAVDSEYILQKLNAPETLHFPNVIPSKTAGFVNSYIETLTPQQQHDLVKIYEHDFKLFDYHFKDLI